MALALAMAMVLTEAARQAKQHLKICQHQEAFIVNKSYELPYQAYQTTRMRATH